MPKARCRNIMLRAMISVSRGVPEAAALYSFITLASLTPQLRSGKMCVHHACSSCDFD